MALIRKSGERYVPTRSSEDLSVKDTLISNTLDIFRTSCSFFGKSHDQLSLNDEAEHAIPSAESIELPFRKKGTDWSEREKNAVADWIITVFSSELVRFAFGFTGSLDLAEEVVAQKVLDAWHYLDTYDPSRYKGKKCPFRNWLYYLVARHACRVVKLQKRFVTMSQSNLPAVNSPGVQELQKKEMAELLEAYESRLPRIYRETATLFYGEELTIKECAERMRCSVAAIKVRLFRVRQKLREANGGGKSDVLKGEKSS